jgi:hypothetical protein
LNSLLGIVTLRSTKVEKIDFFGAQLAFLEQRSARKFF